MWILVILTLVGLMVGLLYAGRTKLAWLLPGAAGLGIWALRAGELTVPWSIAAGAFGALFVLLGLRPVRLVLVSGSLMRAVGRILPTMSDSERIALQAGTVWWDGELFSGNPDWQCILDHPLGELTPAERAFLDGPVEELCRMVNDWDISEAQDLPREAWEFMAEKGFFGMVIPESEGGLGFSARAHSEVITKLASRSTALAVTAMVPNSLGPAELIHRYGTPEQKEHYLPRLARGEEIPCFALTEPLAGSDAGSMRASGVVCRGTYDGREVTGIRLNWSKRYITLAPAATLIGLAFKLRDPDHLLGDRENLGITCALVPADLPGVEVGTRHDPLDCPFLNGPTFGRDVFIPVDAIIGGPEMAGKGWSLLMQCLSVGRGISLPSSSTGGALLATRTVGAYATVREQFNLSVGRLEGVQEAIARIAGTTHALDCLREVTASAVDAGEKPSVLSAVAKYHATEGMRRVINDAMDVVGGAGISLGPRNILGSAYKSAPIGITVEGANILTRCMIIFGQGALRCHPFAQAEIAAVADRKRGAFDRAFFGHVGFVFRNAARSFLLGVTGARLASTPVRGPLAAYAQQVTRLSAAFALAADGAMATLGGLLKRRERLTGRLADALSWQYIACCVIKRFAARGEPSAELPAARWAVEFALHQSQQGLVGFLDNLPDRRAAFLLRRLAFPLGPRLRPPADRLSTELAESVLEGGEARERLTAGMYVPPASEAGLGRLEQALARVVAARPVRAKVLQAVRGGALALEPLEDLPARARAAGVIDADEERRLVEAAEASYESVTVDSFGSERFDPVVERTVSPST